MVQYAMMLPVFFVMSYFLQEVATSSTSAPPALQAAPAQQQPLQPSLGLWKCPHCQQVMHVKGSGRHLHSCRGKGPKLQVRFLPLADNYSFFFIHSSHVPHRLPMWLKLWCQL